MGDIAITKVISHIFLAKFIGLVLDFFLFMTIGAQAFFSLVGVHFAPFTFFTAGHSTSLFL
tara:strand:+ start:76 stop:258 length:183 start_codon:yes stop_codon:yes gene_type:complete